MQFCGNGEMLVGDDFSSITGGNFSTLIAGYGSALTAGVCSKLTGGDYSTLRGNGGSTLMGGKGSTLTWNYWEDERWHSVTAYVGEDGIKPDTPYKLDKNHKPTEVKP